MRAPTTARLSLLHSGAVQLGASVRGMIYGFALIVAVPFDWTGGKPLRALFIGAVALLGIGVEAMIHVRRDQGRLSPVSSRPHRS